MLTLLSEVILCIILSHKKIKFFLGFKPEAHFLDFRKHIFLQTIQFPCRPPKKIWISTICIRLGLCRFAKSWILEIRTKTTRLIFILPETCYLPWFSANHLGQWWWCSASLQETNLGNCAEITNCKSNGNRLRRSSQSKNRERNQSSKSNRKEWRIKSSKNYFCFLLFE